MCRPGYFCSSFVAPDYRRDFQGGASRYQGIDKHEGISLRYAEEMTAGLNANTRPAETLEPATKADITLITTTSSAQAPIGKQKY